MSKIVKIVCDVCNIRHESLTRSDSPKPEGWMYDLENDDDVCPVCVERHFTPDDIGTRLV